MTKLSYEASKVFAYLFPQMNQYGNAIPSTKTISSKTGIPIEKVSEAITELVKEGYITAKVEDTLDPFTSIIKSWTNYRLAF